MRNHNYDMAAILLLVGLVAACEPDGSESSVGGYRPELVDAGAYDSGPAWEAEPDADEPVFVDAGGGSMPVELAPEDLTESEIHELYFGDSDWDCCAAFLRPALCAVLRDRCEADEVVTTDGLGSFCCSPDFGQCPDAAWDDADAGVE